MKMPILAVVLLSALIAGTAYSSDIYVAQDSAGGNTGKDPADSHSAAWFNNSANWGTGPGQIAPGTTVHLCGTITSALAIQGSGASGSPITIVFETNATISGPFWDSGAISCYNTNYITIDGGANGRIIATANGTALANHQSSTGVMATDCNNLEIRKLTISNMYVRTPNSSDDSSGTQGIAISGCSNVLVHHNSIHDAQFGIIFEFATGTTNSQAFSNSISHTATGIVFGSQNTSATAATVLLHDNEIYDEYFWDSPTDLFHCDGIHIWGYGPYVTGLQLYNNYIHGNNGVHITGWLFLEGTVPDALIYNNILEADNGSNPTNAFICIKEPMTAGVYNNTIVGNGGVAIGFYAEGGGTGHIFENNVIVNIPYGVYTPLGDPSIAADYNLYYGVSNWGTSYESWVQWQGAGQDVHGQNGNDPELDANFELQSGSAAIAAGKNLTGLEIAGLDADRAGAARPSSGPWDAGACQYGASIAKPIITSASTAAATVNTAFTYSIIASNNATSFNATPLPAGLNMNTTTGEIFGTPAAMGNFNITISATNSSGTGSATLALTVNALPAITSVFATPNPAIVGQSVSFSVAADDPDGEMLSYSWNFGDGSSGSGASVSHVYSAAGSYTATAAVNDGRGGNASGSVSVTITTLTPLAIAIDSGGGAVGSFAADTDFSGGYKYATSSAISTTGLTNPAPQAVYQTERYGNMKYTIPGLVAGASYTVRLHFAEIYWNAAGQRVFNVAINRQRVLSKFDIYAVAGGKFKAIVETFTATADSNGKLAIVFTTIKDNAKSSGIEVLSSSTGSVVALATAATPGDGPSGSIDLGSAKVARPLKLQLDRPDTGKLRFAIVGRKAFPRGMILNAAGKIIGRPKDAGNYTFQIRIENNLTSVVNTYSLSVVP